MNTTTPNTATPITIALRRFLETGAIVLIAALLVALPDLQAQITTCAAAAPGTYTGCHVNWGVVLAAFAAALISGLVNALTAFLTSLHNVVVGPTLATQTPLTAAGVVTGPTTSFIETKGIPTP